MSKYKSLFRQSKVDRLRSIAERNFYTVEIEPPQIIITPSDEKQPHKKRILSITEEVLNNKKGGY